MEFDNKTVLITGAAGHLGKVVATRFAQAGARLVLVDLKADSLASSFGDTASAVLVSADLLNLDDARRALEKGVAAFGGIDVLCHLAGGFRMGESVHETSDATWDFLLDLNARSFINISRVVVPHLLARGGGKVVSVGAAAAQKGVAQMGAYCASKSAVIRLTEAMSAELKEKNVNVNCVLPTIIDTADNRTAMPDADPARWVAPMALADVIAFLASDSARAVHGAALPVAGLS